MDTKELAARLAAIEAMGHQGQENAFNAPLADTFNALLAELQPDGLEVVIDENWRFSVRQHLKGEIYGAM